MPAILRVFVVIILAVVPATAFAQALVPLSPGTRVRLFAASYAYEATFVEFRADSMVVQPDDWGRSIIVPLETVSRLDIRRGRRWVQGAGVGALVGGALGGAASLLLNALSNNLDPSPAARMGVVSGSVVGAAVGAVVAGHRWKEYGVQQLRKPPRGRRAAVGISLFALAF